MPRRYKMRTGRLRLPRILAAIVVAAISAATLCAAEARPTFRASPTVTRTGAGGAVAFEVDRPTDVAVYVLDAAGKCLRHLAGGMLGGEQPPPEPPK
jgi:hypothetical protein